MLLNNHNVVPEEQNYLLHSVYDIKEVEVDHSDYQALLEEARKVLINDQISVKSEVKSVGEEFIVDDIVQNASRCARRYVCRICLRVTHEAECWKLFDKTRRLFCKQLREKLDYIVDKLNYQVSLNPVVCKECLKLIHTTYNFKKQVEAVEDPIMSKIDERVKSTVDLLSLLDENTEKSSRGRSWKYNKHKGACRNADSDSSQSTSDECNQIVNRFVDGDDCDVLRENEQLSPSNSIKKYGSLEE